MKKKLAEAPELTRDEILAGCQRTRLACDKLSEEERRQLRERALAIVIGHDAKTPGRRR